MRISDWSSDVCSSDLVLLEIGLVPAAALKSELRRSQLPSHALLRTGMTNLGIGIRQFLQPLEAMATGVTGKCIDRHGSIHRCQQRRKDNGVRARPAQGSNRHDAVSQSKLRQRTGSTGFLNIV